MFFSKIRAINRTIKFALRQNYFIFAAQMEYKNIFLTKTLHMA